MSDPSSENDNLFTASSDPELDDLLGGGGSDDVPDFADLFEEDGDDEGQSAGDEGRTVTDPDEGFQKPAAFEEEAKPYFSDKNFYKKILTGEGEVSKRVHSNLGKYLKADDSQDRSMYRQKLIPAHWELASSIASKIDSRIPTPKRLFLRFGVLLPSLITAEQRKTISKIIFENHTGEPIHYVDEWLERVGRGSVSASAVDETKSKGANDAQKVGRQLDHTQGRYDAQLNVVQNDAREIEQGEESLQEQLRIITDHDRIDPDLDIIAPYTDTQKSAFTEISSIIRRLSNASRELARHYNELDSIRDNLESLREKENELGGDSQAVDSKVVVEEMKTVRQMAKLTIGRQGNHFPVLTKQYFRSSLMDIATRENVINVLIDVERLDPGLFLRTFKGQTNRIVPNIILIPCYGDTGICWEPFERFNRATSRGRVAVPMYPKDLRPAIVAAMGDLRWQIAKEKAQHYWMEEGLTGWYYQWFESSKRKGDVKDAFIQDYILWITKESEGTQKLDREVRDILWRYVPFPQDVKDNLKNRGYVYNELYKKDQNRSVSDGY